MLWRIFASSLLMACSADREPAPPVNPHSADFAAILSGVPDRGRDPSVLALRSGDEEPCTAVLVAPDILLTARRCVSLEDTCALRDPASLDVWSGEDLEHASLVGHGHRVVLPDVGCEAELAMVLLDRDVPGIRSSSFRIHGPAAREHVRAVGFGASGEEQPSARLLRDHARVEGATGGHFTINERPCIGRGGHVAMDEDTGEIVGLASELAGCDDGSTYVRADAFFAFIDHVLRRSGEAAREKKAEAKDAGPPDAWTVRKLPKSERPEKDFGAACAAGAECAAGVCVREKSGRYCSRPCDATDRCPYGYRCASVDSSRKACIRTPS